MGLKLLRDVLRRGQSRDELRRLIGLSGMGGRDAQLELARLDPKYNPDCIHLRWACRPDWGFPRLGFRLYRRPHEEARNLDRQRLAGNVIGVPLDERGWRSIVRFDAPVREIRIRFRRRLTHVRIEGRDRDEPTLRRRLRRVQPGRWYALNAVAETLRLSVANTQIEALSFVPVGRDLLQWPEGTLQTWGTPIARFGLPDAAVADAIAARVRRFGIDTGLGEDDLRAALTDIFRQTAALADGRFGALAPRRLDELLSGRAQASDGRPWAGRDGTMQAPPSTLLAMLAWSPSVAEELGLYYRDAAPEIARGQRWDYLVVAAFRPGVEVSAPVYGLSRQHRRPLEPPRLVEAALVRDSEGATRAVPADAPGGGPTALDVELTLARPDTLHDRQPEAVVLTRDGHPLGGDRPTPIPRQDAGLWDRVERPGRFTYQARGMDGFGRLGRPSPVRRLDVAPEDFPAPPPPQALRAAWRPGADAHPGHLALTWLWPESLRRSHRDVDRFVIRSQEVGAPETEREVARVALQPAQAVLIRPAPPLRARLRRAAMVMADPATADPLDAEAALARELLDWARTTARYGGQRDAAAGAALLRTDLALSGEAGGLFLSATGDSLSVTLAGTSHRLPVLSHGTGDDIELAVGLPSDLDPALLRGGTGLMLSAADTVAKRLRNLAGARPVEGLLADASGRGFAVLAARGTHVMLRQRGGDATRGLSADPAHGPGHLVLPQRLHFDLANPAGGFAAPSPAVPVRRHGFTVAAVEAGGREGSPTPLRPTEWPFDAVPPTADVPVAELISLPDRRHRTRVRLGWTPGAADYRCELLRLSESSIRLHLFEQAGAGVSADAVAALDDDALRDLVDGRLDGEVRLPDSLFDLVGTAPGEAGTGEDVLTGTGQRYLYALRLADAAGNAGLRSDVSAPVAPPDLTPPAAPVDLRVQALGGAMRVSWRRAPGADDIRYRLRRGPAGPLPARLLARVAPEAIPVAEPLVIRQGRVALPDLEAEQRIVGGLLGCDDQGRPDPGQDLSPLAHPAPGGEALIGIWQSGQNVLLRAVRPDGDVVLAGTGGEIRIEGGAVDLSALPATAVLQGVFARHLAMVSAGDIDNRAELVNLLASGILDPAGQRLCSPYGPGVAWHCRLEDLTGEGADRVLQTLEPRGSAIVLRDGEIALPYWNPDEARLTGLLPASPHVPSEPGADGDRLALFDYDASRHVLRRRWREARPVALRLRASDGSLEHRRTDPDRLCLDDPAPSGDLAYRVQAGRLVAGTVLWSEAGAAVAPPPAPPVAPPRWRTLTRDALTRRVELHCTAVGPGRYRLESRAADGIAWRLRLSLEWPAVEGGGLSVVDRHGDDRALASRQGDGLQMALREVEPGAVEYRIVWTAPDGAIRRRSLAAAVPAAPDPAE